MPDGIILFFGCQTRPFIGLLLLKFPKQNKRQDYANEKDSLLTPINNCHS
ncbi:MAG: hypothetical protein LBV62_04050 [Rickettsiales bacterium]|nr:hypothetical protein [Rickettsiales bacterium]